MPEYVWGRNAILETLRSSRRVRRILIAKGQPDAPVIAAILHEAERRHIPIETLPRQRLDDLSQGAVHQGCIAVVEARKYATLEQIIEHAHERNEDPFLLILDAVQDVNNLGSLLRSAEAAGVHGVIIPMHRAAEVNATVVKTSAGASEHLLIAQETNLTRTIEWLKKQNIWVIGLDGEAKTEYDKADLRGALTLVVGNEGKGISRLVREHCDLLIKLPMHGHINSLNAAVAGSIALYEALRQRSSRRSKQDL
ncbi:MAG TPA: 23S rRNA (guanosine(2251)-2'-O)-methyltransferase RlmB [Ktedonobacteraceae bacterium]|nr:23S rRNA (guanosine(2251)-2'-O)-methyltransferase RlmB [Ktedonobacteraceae bacterium]